MKTIPLLVLLSLSLFATSPFDIYKLKGNKEGKTLLIFAGVHGNEPGGYFAASILTQYYEIEKGNLWVIPNANKKSIMHFQRGIHGDLNRKFSQISNDDPDIEIIKSIKTLIKNPQVDILLNLHDGHGFFREQYQNTIFNPGAWGQTCVIDQLKLDNNNSIFDDLGCIAEQVSEKLNKHLLKNHHSFNVRNTQTKKKKNAMQHSLTYYAINHNKPAFAIETSKELQTTAQKVYYQLRAIEAFMEIMGIKYKRSFDLRPETVKKITKNYGNLVINGNIGLNLDGLRKNLSYIPLQSKNNEFIFSHPLGGVHETDGFIDLYIGQERISRLHKTKFLMQECQGPFRAIIDGNEKSVHLPLEVKIMSDIVFNAPEGYRLNIIGYTNPKYKNELGIKITRDSLLKRFSLDNGNNRYRAEFYQQNSFCGMVILNYVARKNE